MSFVNDKFTQFKAWFKSKAIIGNIISLLAIVAPELINELTEVISQTETAAIDAEGFILSTWQVLLAIGAQLFSIYGRVVARTKIFFGSSPE